jgi:hypothetical protein
MEVVLEESVEEILITFSKELLQRVASDHGQSHVPITLPDPTVELTRSNDDPLDERERTRRSIPSQKSEKRGET